MTDFAKRLTWFDLVLIGVGGSIGSGIFRSPSQVAAALPSPAWILAAWMLGGAMTLAGSLTFAELGAEMPRAGGQYVWLTEAYGRLVGFLYGWAYFVVVVTGALAALAVVFAEFVGFFVPLGATGTKVVAVSALVVLAGVNVLGVRIAASLGGALTLVKLGALAAIALLAAWKGAGPSWQSHAPLGGLGAALIGVLWSYGGWQHASFAAGEAKNARRDVPRAMIVATAIVTLTYMLANVAYLRLLPLDAIVASPYVASDAVEAAIGRAGGAMVAVAIAASAFGTAGIFTLTTPRVYWAMAESGLFFRSVAELHPRWRTPVRGILLQTSWAVVLVLAWGTFESLVAYVLFVDWLFFGLTGAAVFVMRRKRPGPTPGSSSGSGYRVPLYPLVPLVFIGTSAWFVASTLHDQPTQAIAGMGLLALGLPVFVLWERRKPL
jgi:APA family basic amino acid/polyamine antiporter